MFVSLYILMNALILQLIHWSLCSASFHGTNRFVHGGGHYPSKKAKQLILLFFISNTFIASFQIQLANKYMTQLTLHMNTWNILHLNCWSSQLHTQLKQLRSEIRPVKTLHLNGIRTHDLCDTGIFLGSSNIWYAIYSLLLYGQLREQARWTKSRDVIGYPSGQDRAILPAGNYPLYPARKISPKAI